MKRIAIRVVPAVALLAVGLAWCQPTRVRPEHSGQPSTKNGEWPMYTADLRGSKYSPLDQINATNFSKLEVAWRFKTDNLGPRPENKLEGTPIMVKGMVYTTAGTRRSVVALDAQDRRAEVGRTAMDEGERAALAPRQLSGRGLSYWTDGKGDERIVYVTTGYRLVALNAKTGQPIAVVRQERRRRPEGRRGHRQGQADRSREGRNRPALDADRRQRHRSSSARRCSKASATATAHNAKGLVRAFDVQDRQADLAFNTIPGPGEFGNDTWENGSWDGPATPACGRRSRSIAEAGLVYLPVETPTIDDYGGNRPGNNLFAESLVARRPEDRRSASGTSSSCITGSGTTTSRRRRC